jgi:RNAse (barnase) inhibitor barstar
MASFQIDTLKITDWRSFHDVFATELKFFDGYGRNMDAWIDCMTDLHGEHSLSGHHLPVGDPVVLEFQHTKDFIKRCPEIFLNLIECTIFVNQRYKNFSNAEYVLLKFI